MNKKHFPLEFQKINEVKKINTKPTLHKYFVASNFYNTTQHKPESFYKPISKTFKFEN